MDEKCLGPYAAQLQISPGLASLSAAAAPLDFAAPSSEHSTLLLCTKSCRSADPSLRAAPPIVILIQRKLAVQASWEATEPIRLTY